MFDDDPRDAYRPRIGGSGAELNGRRTMSLSSHISSRALVIAGVVAVTASLGAVPVAGQDTTDDAHGAAVPGLEVGKVSGEAFGAEAEFEALFIDSGPVDLSALLTAARIGDTITTQGILAAAVSNVAAANGSNLTFHDELEPEPEVELPREGGGPISDSEEGLDVLVEGEPLNIADEAEVETEGRVGATGYAESSAAASGLGDSDFIDEIETECHADLDELEGSTRIDSDSDVFPEHPDENTVIEDVTQEITDPGNPNVFLRFRFLQIVNEQDEDEDENTITVNGYREVFNIEIFDTTQGPDPIEFERFEATVGHVHCDIVPAPVVTVVQPTFTG